MARILALSSLVTRGHVGLAAYLPVLHTLGHAVDALPTVVLSNHPGHAQFAGQRIAAETIRAMVAALDANGWLGDVETVLTGYLPSAEHVQEAAALIDLVRLRSPGARVLVDPILGDDPKGLYIDAAAAAAIRDDLICRADLVMPNRFELAWLTGVEVDSPRAAARAAARLPVTGVVATSVPLDDGGLATVHVTSGLAVACTVARRAGVPNGTGDMLAALLAAGWPVGRAVGAVDAAIRASIGQSELALLASRAAWTTAAALPEEAVA